jgi:hypothetical protein
MDKPLKVKPHFYAVCFGSLQKIARDLGYNLLIHGSMDRDMDLVAVPWIDLPCSHLDLIQVFDKFLNGSYKNKADSYMFKMLPGGRSSYIINIHRSYYCPTCKEYTPDTQFYLDISVTTIINISN